MANRLSKPCSVEGCKNTVWARGMCAWHYRRGRLRGEIKTKVYPTICTVEDCYMPYFAGGFCQRHYNNDYYDRKVNGRDRKDSDPDMME